MSTQKLVFALLAVGAALATVTFAVFVSEILFDWQAALSEQGRFWLRTLLPASTAIMLAAAALVGMGARRKRE